MKFRPHIIVKIILSGLVCAVSVPGAITQGRYYIDREDNGVHTVPLGTSDEEMSLRDISSLADLKDGLHFAYLRNYDDSLGWGSWRSAPFLQVRPPSSDDEPGKAEYFLDRDPGEGNGFPMMMNTDTDGNLTASADFSMTEEGLHRIYTRFYSASLGWNPPRTSSFIIRSAISSDLNITAAEYYIGGDPGEGNGTPISIDPANTFGAVFTFPAPDAHGIYACSVRVYSSKAGWGPSQTTYFLIESTPSPEDEITAAEYFFGEDPGEGGGTDLAFIRTGNRVSISSPISAPSKTGLKHLYIRFLSRQSGWGLPQKVAMMTETRGAKTVTLSAAEYFFDTDPGEGKGNPLPDSEYGTSTGTASLTLPVSQAGLRPGTHQLFVRFRDSENKWGPSRGMRFTIASGPLVRLSADTLNFGRIPVSESREMRISISNPANSDLQLTGLLLPAGYNSDFPESGAALAAGDSLSVILRFSPRESVEYDGPATLSFHDGSRTMLLTGSGIKQLEPSITLEPAEALNFGNVDIFRDIHRTHSFTLKNKGNTRLWINSIISTDTLIFRPDFKILADSIDIDTELTFDVTFSPRDTLAYIDTLIISGNSTELPLKFELTGRGSGISNSLLAVNADSLNFGTVQTSTTGETDLILQNTGPDALSISDIQWHSSVFSVDYSSPDDPIPAGDIRILRIRFIPERDGPVTDTLSLIVSDNPHCPVKCILLGIGSSDPIPDIQLSTDSLDFGNIHMNDSTTTRMFTIRNTGTAALNIQEFLFSDSAFSSPSSGSMQILPGNETPVFLQLDPAENRDFNDRMTILNNDPDCPEIRVKLLAAGTFPRLFIPDSTLDYGLVALDGEKDLPLQIENIGTDTLKISGFIFSDSLDTSLDVQPPAFNLPPSETKDFAVMFRPLAARDYRGFLIIQSNAGSDTVTVAGAGYDATPPQIHFDADALRDTLITPGNAIAVSAAISDNNFIQTARLFWRSGGTARFDSVAMALSDDSLYSAVIPPDAVSDRGVEYYIKVSDGMNTGYFPESAPRKAEALRITLPTLPPLKTAAKEYQMISIPAELMKQEALPHLEKNLGAYNNEKYRLFRWENGRYTELSDNTEFILSPGLAYWLITAEEEEVSIDSCLTIPTNENFTLSLDPGWNQVGSPFNFPVSWEDIVAGNPGVIQGSVAWEYSESGWSIAKAMEPFKGYFIATPSGGSHLLIPPSENAANTAASSGVTDFGDDEWGMQLALESGTYHDDDNYLGMTKNSENEWDLTDFSAPRPMSDRYVTLDFDHLSWENMPGLYSGDFKPYSAEGQFWDFSIHCSNTNAPVKLTMTLLSELPPGFKLYLIDPLSNRVDEYDGDINLSYNITNSMDKQYRLVAGTDGYFQENNLGVSLVPVDYMLNQNFPNPFNNRTTITFAIPEETTVSIIIYNGMGQKIKTLLNSAVLSPGYHQVQWNGENGFGERIATGIYFYQMTTENYSTIKKMLLLK